MICSVPQAKTYENAGETREFDKKWHTLKKQSPVNVNCIMLADSLRITCLAVERLYAAPKSICFSSIADKTKPNTRISEFELDLLNWGGKARTGAVDLFENDALKTEQSPSVNMVPNPYFARGLNYIGAYSLFKLWRGMKVSLSKENPKFGEYCLKVPVEPRAVVLSAAVVSVAPGTYTASMYVRSDDPGCSAVLALNAHNHTSYGRKSFSVSKEWKRVSLTCRIPAVSALKLRFSVTAKDPKAVVYVDGFQLEKGGKATEFDVSPVTAQLLTSAPDDFIRHDDPIKARLKLSTLKPNTSGKLTATVRNMFGEELAKSQHEFKFASNEHPEIPLDLDGKIPDGVHTVQVDFEVNGKKYSEFSRFSVMPFFSNRHKMRNMFSPLYSGFIRDGLGVDGRRTTAANDGEAVVPIFGVEGDARRFHHVQNTGKQHFVLHGKTHHIKITEGLFCFQTHQGDIVLLQKSAEVKRGGKAPLAHDVFLIIQNVIKDLQTKVGHPDFVQVGHTNAKTHVARFFHVGRVVLAAAVARRFLRF